MERIKKLVDEISDELCSAKEYAEEFLTLKAKDKIDWAKRYDEMAHDELKHADYLHERVVSEIDELSKAYTPPEEMMEKWNADHKKYIEKAAWIRQMLTM